MSSPATKKRKGLSIPPSPAKKHKASHQNNLSDLQFQRVNVSLTLSIQPIFAANPRAGAEEMLDSMVMRYVPAMNGVLLAHSNLIFTLRKAVIQRDCPSLICPISFDAIIWRPTVGLKICGSVNLCSPDHISLLVHRTFNVSIPRNHIPQDQWEFEYGPAENDPEFASDNHHNGGHWVHRITNERLGGSDGVLDFTVIGLTIANEMLSLLGSLQPDPFSPRHLNSMQSQEQADGIDSSTDTASVEEDSEEGSEEQDSEDE